MLDETTKGVFTIAVTPFLPDGALDFDSIDRMVDAYIERGANGLTVLGMMGEAGKLTAEENFQLGADRMTEDELADYQANKPRSRT